MRSNVEFGITLLVIAGLTCWLGGATHFADKFPVESASANGAFPRVIEDDYGSRMTLPRPPSRIASVTLVSDEVLLELLPPERLVACTYFARDPGISGCAEKAKLVETTVNGDVEEIIALQPDLVIVAGFTTSSNVELLRGTGLPVYRFGRYDTLEDIRHNIRRLGWLVGAENGAELLVAGVDRQLDLVRDRVVDRPKPRVLNYSPDGYTTGSETIFDDLLSCAGGANAAAEAGIVGHQKISTEIAIALNPDVVVFGGTFASADGEMQDPLDFLRSQPAWQQVAAVQNHRVHVLSAKTMTSISHHVVDGAEQLARLLHPSCFEGVASDE